jgi:hypothetical protein
MITRKSDGSYLIRSDVIVAITFFDWTLRRVFVRLVAQLSFGIVGHAAPDVRVACAIRPVLPSRYS